MSTNKDKEDEDSSTKQILEYYRKYSQSKDLPKYFSGSVQYLPKIVDDDDEESTKAQTENNTKATVVDRGRRYENYEPDIELSPTGSAASNRKLEWDSLGDIGYIQRSSSLPILTQDKHFESNKEPKGNNVKIVILPYTSSSEASSERNTLPSSSSSSPLTKKDTPTISSTSEEKQKSLTSDLESPGSDKKIVDFQQSLDYLKKKIGLPEAHSTPKDPQTKNDEKVNVEACENEEIDIPLNPTKKVINLCLTKPLLLDCLSHTNVRKLNIGIQTDNTLKKTVHKQSHELVTFYKHSDTLKTSSDSGKSTSSNAVASKCDSFEYVKNNSASVENENIPIENPELTNNAYCKEDPVDSVQPVTSTDVNLIENDIKTSDIERGIYVLQRLIKSKKYDSSTKKKYIKKILQKITESKYLDDSNSSTNSDLFYPKVDTVKILQDQLKNSTKINKPDCTDSDLSSAGKRKAGPFKSESTPSTSKADKILHSDCTPRQDKKKTLSDKGIVKELNKESTREPKKTLFTVTKCQEISSDQSSSSPQSYQNWKELKTVSEKFFENNARTEGGGDQISQFANKEREYQLNWIEKEIDHLGKLKSILEKTKKPCLPPKCMKKTSVYMVAASNNNEIKRNYVIETKLGNVGRSQHRNFRINGETYTVKDPNSESFKDPQPVVADIQVLSTDTTTNIKVTTFCNICKRAPCVCVTDFLQGISNPFKISDDKVKNHLDSKSKTCTCSSISSSTTSGNESSNTICIVCHRSPCTCCACKQIHNVKTCSVCQLYTCMCNISPKGSVQMEPYVGTFIPTARPDQVLDKTKNLCRKCKGCPCICGLSSNGSSSKKATSGTSSKSTSNSLAKVFVDCKCGPSRECNCNFVDKLMRHFSKEGFRRSDQSKPRRSIEELRTETSQSKNEDIKKKVDNFSQGDTDISSGSFKTDESAQIGVQKVPFREDISIKQFASEKETSVPKNVINLDQCVCTKEEKAVHPVNICLTKDKCIGKAVKETATQNDNRPTFKTAETSRLTTTDKNIECNCEQTDKSIGTASKKDSVDRCTSPKTSFVDKGTECEPRGSLVDQATSPKRFHTDQSTASERRGVFVDDSTSSTPLLVDKGTEYTSRRTSLDKFTSCASTRVDKGTEWDPKSFVDKSVSPVGFNVDKGTDWGARKTSEDKSTSTGYSQTDRATGNVKKSMLNNGTSPAAFVGDKDDGTEPEDVTDVVDKGTSPGRFQTDQGTTGERRKVLVNDSTSSTPIFVDKGSEYSSKIISFDKFTSNASARVNKGTEWDSKSFVDKSVSPVGFNVDKETDWGARKTSEDKSTSTGYSQTDRATENVKKSMLNNGTLTFIGDKDGGIEPDDVTDVADEAETKIGTQIQTEKMKQNSTRTVSKETNISNNVVNSKVFVNPNNKRDDSSVTSDENNNKSTQTNKLIMSNGGVENKFGNIHSNSVNVQTDLLSKDIRSSRSSTSSWEKYRKKKSKNGIICICSGEKMSRSKIICICSPCEEPENIFCTDDVGGKKSRRCCICRSSCKVDSRSMSSSPSRSKNREERCKCNVKKSRAKRASSPKIKSVMMDVSETDDSMPTNASSNCTCYCCETSVPLEKISLLRSDDQEFPVCKKCLDKRPILTAVSFAGPGNKSSSNPSEYTKRCENFCTCKRNPKAKDFIYCSHCKNRLRKTQQNRNGIAYTLTLEHEPPENFKTRTKKKLKKLEEIKIKVPNPYNRKQRKNNENNNKRYEDRMKKLESGENTEDEPLYFTKNETSSKTDSSDTINNKKNTDYTLQEYLIRNRPGFVNAAEFRRLALINNKIERELNKDDLKLKFLEQNAHNNILKRQRLFSEQEMREITKRNYKKLPEVQKKLIEKRVQRLRSADKFMADTLKRKIQNCVLKGKSSFPIDTNIINVYK